MTDERVQITAQVRPEIKEKFTNEVAWGQRGDVLTELITAYVECGDPEQAAVEVRGAEIATLKRELEQHRQKIEQVRENINSLTDPEVSDGGE